MVRVGKKNFNKRVGQAINGNGFNGQMMNAFNGNAQMLNGNGTRGRTNPSVDLLQGAQAFNQMQLPEEDVTVDEFEEELDVDIDGTYDEQGNRFIVVTDDASGSQAYARFPAPIAQPPAPPVQDDVCQFPAQSLELERRVDITTSLPEIVNLETDICGNTIGMTERVTRTMSAGEWVPVSGLSGPVVNGYVNGNGVVRGRTVPPVPFANSPGLTDFNGVNESVVSNRLFYQNGGVNGNAQMVGGAKRGYHGNQNASKVASMMRSFRQG